MTADPPAAKLASGIVGLFAATVFSNIVYDTLLWIGAPEVVALTFTVSAFLGALIIAPPLVLSVAWIPFAAYYRKHRSITTFGVYPWHRAKEADEIPECLNCGSKGVEGYRAEFGRYRFVFGVALWQIDGGVHHDCRVCFEDPIEAALRRDDPSRVEPPGSAKPWTHAARLARADRGESETTESGVVYRDPP